MPAADPEAIPVADHEFCIGAAFRPEFTSKPGAPAPLFLGLLLAAREEGRSGMGIRKVQNITIPPAAADP